MQLQAQFKVIGGQPKTSTIVTEFVEYLQNLPDQEIMTVRGLADATGRLYKSIREYIPDPRLDEYRVLVAGKNYLGNRKTIKSLRKQLGGKRIES
jgi:hypothetical protein